MNKDYQKVTIYPFNGDYIPFVKYLNKYSEILHVTELVAPTGWGLNWKDAGVIYNKPEVGLIVSDDLHRAMGNCDVLMIAENKLNENFHQIIINNIIATIESQKDIICTMKLPKNELEQLKQISTNFGVRFTYSPEETHWEYLRDTLYFQTLCALSRKLYTPRADVIFVGELIDGIDGFDVLLSVTDYLKSIGYKILTIGARDYCELIGLFSLPSFITQVNISDSEKIHTFNSYIKYLDEKEKPDIFVIQLPGGMMKYNDQFTNGFGVTPYLMSQAVQGDYFILSTQYDKIHTKFYYMLSNAFKYRFGFEIDCIHMSNTLIDIANSIGLDKLTYLHLEQHVLDDTINQYYRESEISIYNIDNLLDRNKMFSQLQEALSDNVIHHMV